MTTNNDDINVANNVAQANSQDLTEQWKKGELKEGEEYWVILTDEWYLRNPVEPVRAFYSCDCEFEGYLDDDIKEVLAPVPSYEEWQELKLHDEKATIKLGEKIIENDKLKELLKECRDFFYENLIDTEFYFSCGLGSDIKKQSCIRSLSKLKTKIDEVLK